MNIEIGRIKQSECEAVASWDYPEDYPWTMLGRGSENEIYLLSEKLRDGHYYALHDRNGLIGYFSINDKIRKEYGALQLVIRPDLCTEENETEIIRAVETAVSKIYPFCIYLNAIAYDSQVHAIEIYERCGFDNKGIVSGQGHDMQTYEQEGFDNNGTLQKQVSLVILSKKLR